MRAIEQAMHRFSGYDNKGDEEQTDRTIIQFFVWYPPIY